MLNLAIVAITSFVFASAASAHPGHGDAGGGFSLAHYLSEPDHVVFALLLVSAVLAAARAYRHRRSVTRLTPER